MERRLNEMLSRKIIVLAVTSLLIMSMLSCLVFASVVCPKCHGTGKVPSASCLVCGGTGQIQPNVTSSGIALGTNQTATNFTAVYHNNEAVDVYGVATATLNTQKTTLTETSNRTLLKALPPSYIHVPR
jgi:hypothetical protein